MLTGDIDAIKSSGYIEKYPYQMGMVWVVGNLYKIFKTTNYKLIQYINIIANIITFIFMYLILKNLGKKYKVNETIYWIMCLTFIPLILLTTYVYGDYIGLALCISGVYFIMKYKESNKIAYFIISAVTMALAYITKTNYLIIILAILIYLAMYLIQDIYKKRKRKIINNIVCIIVFMLITLIPFNCIKNHYANKYECRKEHSIPTSVWIYIGMTESSRANGWYGESALESWKDTPLAHKTYPQKVKQRVKELITHPIYMGKFYFMKTVSGWADPYFQSIWYNVGVQDKDEIMSNIMKSKKYKLIEIYQKALTILIYGGALIAIIKNRKNLNNELILLFTIFIGGMLFHTLWEMKSRYTLPYVIMLIPISAIGIQNIEDKLKTYKIKRLNKQN